MHDQILFEPSSVFLQLVRSKRLSSTTKAFTRFSSVSGSMVSATSLERTVVNLSQFVFFPVEETIKRILKKPPGMIRSSAACTCSGLRIHCRAYTWISEGRGFPSLSVHYTCGVGFPLWKYWKKEEIALKSSCPSLSCGRIELGMDLLLCMVVSRQFNYTKGSVSVPYLLLGPDISKFHQNKIDFCQTKWNNISGFCIVACYHE